jgi:protein SCO1/2
MALLAVTTACRYIKNSCFALTVTFVCFACKQPTTVEKETLPFYNTPTFDAAWIAPTDVAYPTIHTIDTFRLSNQLGHTITKDSLNGHIYIANFFFTTCLGICPKMTNNLITLQDTFANNPQIKLVSFSVMPWVDSVGRLKEYATEHHINPNKWHLLTGGTKEIYDLGRKSYFAEKGLGVQKDTSQFLHTETMLLIDKKGRIRGIYNATQKVDISRVVDDVAVLVKE